LPLPELQPDTPLAEVLSGIGSTLAKGDQPDYDLWTRTVYEAYGLLTPQA